MHLEEKNEEARPGRTKVRMGTDVEVSYTKLGCVQTQRQGEPGSDSRGTVRDYKELVTKAQTWPLTHMAEIESMHQVFWIIV